MMAGVPWGCSVKGAKTNQDALVKLTNWTYIFGVAEGKNGSTDRGTYRGDADTKACVAAKIPIGNCGLFPVVLGTGCHFNMVLSCLGGTGALITFGGAHPMHWPTPARALHPASSSPVPRPQQTIGR